MVRDVRHENLGLVLETPKCPRVHDPVTIPLEGRPELVVPALIAIPFRLVRQRRPGRES
jgi:hypothetical protein